MRSFIYIILISTLLVTGLDEGFSQIMGVGHSYIDTTSEFLVKQDSIFVFCSPEDSNVGSLVAQSKFGGNDTFTWFKYNQGTNVFDPYFGPFGPAVSSTINDLEDGGYRVELTTSGEVYTAWVYNHQLRINSIVPDTSFCSVTLTSDIEYDDEFLVYDYNDLGSIDRITTQLSALWGSSPDVGSSSGSAITWSPETPTLQTTYTLTIDDNYFCNSFNSIVVDAIMPGPNFTFETDKDDEEDQDAPLEVTFTDETDSPDIYLWNIFYYTNENRTEDSLYFISTAANPMFVFERPGDYRAELYVTSPHGCLDSYIDEISVDSVKLEIPNFFSPNGDGINDVFIVRDVSIQNISINIFTRWGAKVHEYDGPAENWEGWNGKVKHTNRDALPGVYYYVIYFYGWDEVYYENEEYTGFLHLFREP